MSNKHLPRLFAQALNDKRVELFDEFIHPEYNNHNAYVEPGPAGVKAFFRHYLDAFSRHESCDGGRDRIGRSHQRSLHL